MLDAAAGVKRGHDSEQHPRCGGDRERKPRNCRVDMRVFEAWNAGRCQPYEDIERPRGKEQRTGAAGSGKDDAFGQDLSDEAAPACSNRPPDRQLSRSRRRADEN